MSEQSLPPRARTLAGLSLNEFVPGELHLQVCAACNSVQYPPRELCGDCLSGDLEVKAVSGVGTVVASTELHHSLEAFFRERLPWQLASVRLDVGPVVFVALRAEDNEPGKQVRVCQVADAGGQWILIAADRDVALQDEKVRHEIVRSLGLANT